MFLKYIAAALRCFVFFEQKPVCSSAALFLVMDSGTSISPFSPVFGLLRSPEGAPFCDENASVEWTKIQLKAVIHGDMYYSHGYFLYQLINAVYSQVPSSQTHVARLLLRRLGLKWASLSAALFAAHPVHVGELRVAATRFFGWLTVSDVSFFTGDLCNEMLQHCFNRNHRWNF